MTDAPAPTAAIDRPDAPSTRRPRSRRSSRTAGRSCSSTASSSTTPDAKRIVGIKAVTATEWFFQGHFPGLPVMPGVLQVEALAQTMAVYVAQQPGFGDRIGLFAGIDEVRFKRVVVPGDTLRLEVTMEKLGSPLRQGPGVASVDGEVACEGLLVLHHPAGGGAAMTRLAALSDVHGNAIALEAVLKPTRAREAGRRARRRRPRAQRRRTRRSSSTPCARCERRRPSSSRATPTSRSADFDYAAAFPWTTDGVPGRDPGRRRVGPRRARRRPARLAPPPAGRAPLADRRRHARPRLPRLARARRRPGFDQALDPNVTIERVARTDARVIVCGHTHLPEVRDLGWKVIVNDGSAGYVFDGEPDRLVGAHRHRRRRGPRRDPADRVRRPRGGQRDLRARPARRRLPRGHGPHREAGPMTGAASGRRHRDGHGHRPRAGRGPDLGRASSPGAPASAPITAFDPSRVTVADRRRGPGLRRQPASSTARTCGGPTATSSSGSSPRARRWTRPGCPARLEGDAGRGDRRHPRHRARRRGHALRRHLHQCPARPGPDQPVPHPDGHPQRRGRARSPSTSG